MPKISVIIPIYNVEKYLKRALESICNQTLKDLEIICIDDCSTDNSLNLLNELAQQDNRIKVIRLEQNSGAAVARNKGLEAATGEYLGFIDPDDEIDNNFYETLYEKAVSENADIVKGGLKQIELDGRISLSTLNERIKAYGKYRFLREWTTAIYRHKLITDNNITFPEQCRKSQDVAFLNSCILASDKVVLVDDVYYSYIKREGSLHSSKIPLASIKSALESYNIILNNINNSDLYQTDSEAYMYLYSDKLSAHLTVLGFRNDTIESKKLCAERFIEQFYKCKNTDALYKSLKEQGMSLLLRYIKQHNAEKITELLLKYKDYNSLLNNQITIPERIFSIRHSHKRRHLILNILGIQLKFKNKSK